MCQALGIQDRQEPGLQRSQGPVARLSINQNPILTEREGNSSRMNTSVYLLWGSVRFLGLLHQSLTKLVAQYNRNVLSRSFRSAGPKSRCRPSEEAPCATCREESFLPSLLASRGRQPSSACLGLALHGFRLCPRQRHVALCLQVSVSLSVSLYKNTSEY